MMKGLGGLGDGVDDISDSIIPRLLQKFALVHITHCYYFLNLLYQSDLYCELWKIILIDWWLKKNDEDDADWLSGRQLVAVVHARLSSSDVEFARGNCNNADARAHVRRPWCESSSPPSLACERMSQPAAPRFLVWRIFRKFAVIENKHPFDDPTLREDEDS